MNHHEQKAKSRTQPLSRSQESRLLSQPGSHQKLGANCSIAQHQSIGDAGKGSAGRIAAIAFGLSGGILSQLITETKDRLAEMQSCVTWYEDQVNKYEQKLSNLQQLEEFIEKAKVIQESNQGQPQPITEASTEND